MDDQNPQNQQGAAAGGTQPAGGDAALPWMNFSPDASASGAAGAAATDPATTGATGGFDPFGNPFATGGSDAVASAFAPSTADGSMQPAANEPAAFTPSEPSAFTPEPVATETAPLWTPEPAAQNFEGGDSLELLASLKANFDAEEQEFKRQIEEHEMNIKYEKEQMDKLRKERSDRLSKMRELVRSLEDMLGIQKKPEQNHRPQERSNDRPRNEESRKAERVQNKPKQPQNENSGINDFLAA